MYDIVSGSFKCAPAVQVTIHPAHNPSLVLPVQGGSQTPVFINVSLSHARAPLPLGPFLRPVLLDCVVASGGTHPLPTGTRATSESFTRYAVAVLQVLLHSCTLPFPPGSSMQSCSFTFPALPFLNAVLVSPIGAYTTHVTVYSAVAASLLPAFASKDDKAATVRIGHGTCDVVSASSPVAHAHLNDFGSASGFLQVLRLKACAPSSVMWDARGVLAQQAVSDIVLSAAGSVVIVSSAAIARLLQVQRLMMSCIRCVRCYWRVCSTVDHVTAFLQGWSRSAQKPLYAAFNGNSFTVLREVMQRARAVQRAAHASSRSCSSTNRLSPSCLLCLHTSSSPTQSSCRMTP